MYKRAVGKHEITYRASKRTTSQNYLELLPLVNAGAVAVLDHQLLLRELRGLEREGAAPVGAWESAAAWVEAWESIRPPRTGSTLLLGNGIRDRSFSPVNEEELLGFVRCNLDQQLQVRHPPRDAIARRPVCTRIGMRFAELL